MAKRTLQTAIEELKASARPFDKDDDDTEGKTAESIRTELKKRGLSGWDAYKCCFANQNVITRYLEEIADTMEGFRKSMKLGLVPPPVPSTVVSPLRWITAPAQGSPGPGVAAIGMMVGQIPQGKAWVEVDSWWIPEDNAEEALMQRTLRGAARATRAKRDDCYRCIKRRLWGQKKKRQWVTPRPLRKGPRTRNSLLLRVPHQ